MKANDYVIVNNVPYVPAQNEVIISIDPGRVNMGFCVEIRSVGCIPRTPFLCSLSFSDDVVDHQRTVYHQITTCLNGYSYYLNLATLIIIERQEVAEVGALKIPQIAQHLLTYFSIYYTILGKAVPVVDISSHCKLKRLDAPSTIKGYAKRDKWHVTAALALLTERNDGLALEMLSKISKKSDPAVAIIQIEAFFRIVEMESQAPEIFI
jgi:hypothetical protein